MNSKTPSANATLLFLFLAMADAEVAVALAVGLPLVVLAWLLPISITSVDRLQPLLLPLATSSSVAAAAAVGAADSKRRPHALKMNRWSALFSPVVLGGSKRSNKTLLLEDFRKWPSPCRVSRDACICPYVVRMVPSLHRFPRPVFFRLANSRCQS